MVLVGCGVMPHSPMILQPGEDQIAHLPEVQEVHEACLALADQIRERRPHAIVLVTPHGLTVEQGVTGVYMNSWARGSAEWSGSFSNTQVQIELDVLASRSLLTSLKTGGCRARGIEFFGGGRSAAVLGWAEVVPLWFLDDILGFSRFIVVSQGVSEGFAFGELDCMTRAEAQSMLASVTEMIKIGQVLSDWADSGENKDKRIFVIVSAALSHSHGGHGGRLNRNRQGLDDGSLAPDELLSPCYLSERTLEMRSHDSHEHDAAAHLYDQAVEFWLRTLRPEGLLVTARKAVPLAQPCGFSVFVILHGVLDGRNHDVWEKNLLIRCAPTNFGMCVSSLLPRWDRLPAEIMDTLSGHLLLDQGNEYQLMPLKCWFSDFGDFLDIHGEMIIMPELVRTPTPAPTEPESEKSSKEAGSRQQSGQSSRQRSGQGSRLPSGQGQQASTQQDASGDDEEGESDEEDQWESMLGEENKKNAEHEAHRAWLEEQERLAKTKKRTPILLPTRAEKQIAQVEELIPGRVLVVFAETLSHLHEQCILAARAGCIAVIVIGVPDAEFTLDEYKLLRSCRTSSSTARDETAAASQPKSPMSMFGGMLSPRNRTSLSIPEDDARHPIQPHSVGGSKQGSHKTDSRPNTKSTRRDSTNSRPATGSTRSESRMKYGRVAEEESEEDENQVVLTDGHSYRFFKIPIPVVWVSSEDAVYMSDGCIVSLYWHENLIINGEPQPTAKKNSMHGLASIQKRLLETDPDLHAKQIMHLKLEMAAKEQLLHDKELANAKLQEQLSRSGHSVMVSRNSICARHLAPTLGFSALRELKQAKLEHRQDLDRHELEYTSPLSSPCSPRRLHESTNIPPYLSPNTASSRPSTSNDGTRGARASARTGASEFAPWHPASASTSGSRTGAGSHKQKDTEADEAAEKAAKDAAHNLKRLEKRAAVNAGKLISCFQRWCAEDAAEDAAAGAGKQSDDNGDSLGKEPTLQSVPLKWRGLGPETLASFVLESYVRRKLVRLQYLGQLARMRRFASVLKPRTDLSLGSTASFNGRAIQSGAMSPNADRWQHSAGRTVTNIMYDNSPKYEASPLHLQVYKGGLQHHLDLSALMDASREEEPSASPSSSPHKREPLGQAGWDPRTPRDRYTFARSHELLPAAIATLPNTSRLGPGPWHYESLVSATRRSLTRSPCFSPRLSAIASSINHREAVNPAPGHTLHSRLKMEPSLALRTRMLPVYDRAALDLVDRRPHPIRGTPPCSNPGYVS